MEPRHPTFENVKTIFERVKANIRRRTNTPEFPFHLLDLDALTHGLQRGKLTIIAARTSEGKTSFALQTAWQLADIGRTVAFISLEDDREQLVEKLFCNTRRVDNAHLRRGESPVLDDPAIDALFDRLPLLVLDDFGYNIEEIQQVVRELEPRPELIVLDYIQMCDQHRFKSEYESISFMSRRMKRFAEQENIGVVMVSQINRKGIEDGRPKTHHLQGSGALEQNADLVLILYWPFLYGGSSHDYSAKDGTGMRECPLDYVEIEVAKQKTGPRGIVPVRFVAPQYRFEDWIDAQHH